MIPGRTFALVGNPNVGKTALFNALTGLHQSTGNYAGVTIERKHGKVRLDDGQQIELIDLPGAYSLAARSPDEMIVADVLLDQQPGEKKVDGIVAVLDASNLERNLYFLSQLLEFGKPIVVALNMMDIAERRGLVVDFDALSAKLGVPAVPVAAHKGRGIPALRAAIAETTVTAQLPQFDYAYPEPQALAVNALTEDLNAQRDKIGREVPRLEAFRILVDEGGYAEARLVRKLGPAFRETLAELRRRANTNGSTLAAQESRTRYQWVREVMDAAVTRPTGRRMSRSHHLDGVLTHRLWGSIIFLSVMLVVFQSIYSWSAPLMDAIDGLMGGLGEWAAAALPDGMLESLIVDGAIAGVGGVIIFLPQILLLSLFIALLEDFGYMARAAFLMDKLFSWCGLSGQSFIPMLSSFACAIPGILATRTIHDRHDRFTTILVAPLMSCSARLPVYVIMIGAFVPARDIAAGGFINLQGLVLFAMYLLGVFVAIPVAYILQKTLFRGDKSPFILEMPSYKIPQFRTVALKVYREGKEFIIRAGTLIFAVTIIVWALAYFPRSEAIIQQHEAQRAALEQSVLEGDALDEALVAVDDAENGELLRNSFLGRMGHFIEPVFIPLGWDWRIATATIASFPAREIIVATLGTLFNMGADEDESSEGLIATLRAATWPDGRLLFTLPVAFSIMVFFALCCQCAATLAVIKRETGSWRWPALTFAYMTLLAYVAALITYQGMTALGIGVSV